MTMHSNGLVKRKNFNSSLRKCIRNVLQRYARCKIFQRHRVEIELRTRNLHGPEYPGPTKLVKTDPACTKINEIKH